MLLWVCSVIDHRRRQNVLKTSVTHLPAARVPLQEYPTDPLLKLSAPQAKNLLAGN